MSQMVRRRPRKGHTGSLLMRAWQRLISCLAANALELGTLIMGRYDEGKIKEILRLPDEYDVSAIIAIGYPAVIPAANERKPLKEVLAFL